MAAQQAASITWAELSGPARTLLYAIARRERDGQATTRQSIRDGVTDPGYPQLTDEQLLESFPELEDAGLIEAAELLDPYQVTTAGRDLLASQALRLESTINTTATDDVDWLAVCPRCGNPITALTTTWAGDLTPAACECFLPKADLDSTVATLLDVYPSVTDRDAAQYLRQAIYLLLPRENE